MIRARSFLFAPALRPELREKALASGTDIACLDLEDAVPPSKKDAAREGAIDWIAALEPNRPLRAVRINPLSTRHGPLELHVISAAQWNAVRAAGTV